MEFNLKVEEVFESYDYKFRNCDPVTGDFEHNIYESISKGTLKTLIVKEPLYCSIEHNIPSKENDCWKYGLFNTEVSQYQPMKRSSRNSELDLDFTDYETMDIPCVKKRSKLLQIKSAIDQAGKNLDDSGRYSMYSHIDEVEYLDMEDFSFNQELKEPHSHLYLNMDMNSFMLFDYINSSYFAKGKKRSFKSETKLDELNAEKRENVYAIINESTCIENRRKDLRKRRAKSWNTVEKRSQPTENSISSKGIANTENECNHNRDIVVFNIVSMDTQVFDQYQYCASNDQFHKYQTITNNHLTSSKKVKKQTSQNESNNLHCNGDSIKYRSSSSLNIQSIKEMMKFYKSTRNKNCYNVSSNSFMQKQKSRKSTVHLTNFHTDKADAISTLNINKRTSAKPTFDMENIYSTIDEALGENDDLQIVEKRRHTTNNILEKEISDIDSSKCNNDPSHKNRSFSWSFSNKKKTNAKNDLKTKEPTKNKSKMLEASKLFLPKWAHKKNKHQLDQLDSSQSGMFSKQVNNLQ